MFGINASERNVVTHFNHSHHNKKPSRTSLGEKKIPFFPRKLPVVGR